MKKKILFITYNLKLGGTSSTLYDLVQLIDKDKYDVTIFTIHDGGDWEPRFREHGVPVINAYTNMQGGKGLWKKVQNHIMLMRIKYIRKHMGKGFIECCVGEKFDLVVLHHSYEPYELAPFLSGAATIRYIHGDVKNNPRYRWVLDQSAEHFSKFDRIICVSKVAKQSFVEAYGCADKTLVCYNPINSDEINQKSEQSVDLHCGVPYICVVGRLAPEKGVERLVRIHGKLIQDGVQHKLLIVGEGPERSNIERAVKETGTQDSVILVGYQDNPYPYIRNSYFTVCPSYSEGLHMASMESLCLGVPVVSAVEPVQELFGDEFCGIIAENDDASLEAGIRKMLTDADFYQQAKRGAQKRSSAFRAEVMIKQVEQIYDAVMEGKK